MPKSSTGKMPVSYVLFFGVVFAVSAKIQNSLIRDGQLYIPEKSNHRQDLS